MIREACVAGMFYEDNIKLLRESIEDSFNCKMGPGSVPKMSLVKKGESISAIMVPHAGYIYSGAVAAHAYFKLAEAGFPETFVIIGPNHTGMGKPVSVFNEGTWMIPIGKVEVDSEMADEIISKSKYAQADFTAHLKEHSVEVQLPFLKFFSNDFRIVPICMMDQSPTASRDLAEAIYEASMELGRKIVIIDSTDLSHFKSQELTEEHDRLVFNEIRKGDTDGLYETVTMNNITMCGYGPTMVAMEYSKKVSNYNFEFLKSATSGDTTLDYKSVVGYGSGVFKIE